MLRSVLIFFAAVGANAAPRIVYVTADQAAEWTNRADRGTQVEGYQGDLCLYWDYRYELERSADGRSAFERTTAFERCVRPCAGNDRRCSPYVFTF